MVSSTSSLLGGKLHADDAVALVELHRDLAVAVDLDEVGELVPPHLPLVVANITSSVAQLSSSSGSGRIEVIRSPALERQEVDQRLAARGAATASGSRQTFSL